jgi:hypothetical protein
MLLDDTVQLHGSFSCEKGDHILGINYLCAFIDNKSIGGCTYCIMG